MNNKTYEVEITQVSTAILKINASSPEEAKAEAEEIREAGNISYDDEFKYRVKEIS